MVSTVSEWIFVVLPSIAPVSELRGAILFGVSVNLPLFILFSVATICNLAVFFIVYAVMDTVYHHRTHLKIIIDLIERARRRGEPFMHRYGLVGLFLLVAIPLPATGVWTGTVVALLFGLGWKKALPPILSGILVAGTIMMLAATGTISTLNIFL